MDVFTGGFAPGSATQVEIQLVSKAGASWGGGSGTDPSGYVWLARRRTFLTKMVCFRGDILPKITS